MVLTTVYKEGVQYGCRDKTCDDREPSFPVHRSKWATLCGDSLCVPSQLRFGSHLSGTLLTYGFL